MGHPRGRMPRLLASGLTRPGPVRTRPGDRLQPLDPTSGGVMHEAKKILVPVNGNPTDAAMLALAAQTVKRTKGRIYAIHVIEVRRNLPLDADLVDERELANKVLDEAERIA